MERQLSAACSAAQSTELYTLQNDLFFITPNTSFPQHGGTATKYISSGIRNSRECKSRSTIGSKNANEMTAGNGGKLHGNTKYL